MPNTNYFIVPYYFNESENKCSKTDMNAAITVYRGTSSACSNKYFKSKDDYESIGQ